MLAAMGAAGRLISTGWWRCAVACALGTLAALAATASAAHGAVAPVPAAIAKHLALMPLSAADIGPRASSFALSHRSGVQTNGAFVDDALSISKQQLAATGRISGYMLDYEDPEAALFASGRGLGSVMTAVHLFAESAGADKFLAFEVQEMRAAVSFGIIHYAAAPAPSLGDRAIAFRSSFSPLGMPRVGGATVLFRVGALVGMVEVTTGDAGGDLAFANGLAAKLLARLHGVMSGAVVGAPVPLRAKRRAAPAKEGPSLAQLALTAADVAGAVTAARYEVDDALYADAAYIREFSTAGGASQISEEIFHFDHLGMARAKHGLIGAMFGSRALWQKLTTDELSGAGQKATLVEFIRVAPFTAGPGAAIGVSMAARVGQADVYLQQAYILVGARVLMINVADTKPLTVAGLKRLAGVAAARAQGPA